MIKNGGYSDILSLNINSLNIFNTMKSSRITVWYFFEGVVFSRTIPLKKPAWWC
tara:strand:+ start:163 stop:324 length:162 start_codon:yes stop_codon:yes gene_type:complete